MGEGGEFHWGCCTDLSVSVARVSASEELAVCKRCLCASSFGTSFGLGEDGRERETEVSKVYSHSFHNSYAPARGIPPPLHSVEDLRVSEFLRSMKICYSRCRLTSAKHPGTTAQRYLAAWLELFRVMLAIAGVALFEALPRILQLNQNLVNMSGKRSRLVDGKG